MSSIALLPGDNRASLRRLIDKGVRVHSVVTDPPYGLTSIEKRFGKKGAAAARTDGNDGSFARLSGGFMGKAWDGTGIERDPEFWKLIYEILLPGGYVFAFSGSRTGHWQAVAMETAGFIMHPMHGWVFGSGFPKASNAARAIDCHLCQRPGRHYESSLPTKDRRPGDHICDETREGDAWRGHAYGTQAQKPALEPIYLGQKPFDTKTGAENLLKHGVGAVNIDACRVAIDPMMDAGQLRTMSRGQRTEDLNGQKWGLSKGDGDTPQVVRQDGRHPANLILDGSPNVVALFPESKGQIARSSSGSEKRKTQNVYGAESRAPGTLMTDFGDEGSAARFFHQFPLTEEDYEWAIEFGLIGDPSDIPPLIYNAKAGKTDRAGSLHPTVKPIALIANLIRHVTPKGGIVLDPFAGSGTTAAAASRGNFDCILMEAETEYVEFIHTRFALPDTAPAITVDPEGRTMIGKYAYRDFDLTDLLGEPAAATLLNSTGGSSAADRQTMQPGWSDLQELLA